MCLAFFSYSGRKRKAIGGSQRKNVREDGRTGCLYYYGGVVYPDGEWVCPAENNSLEIIDPGTSKNNLSTKLFYDRYEKAKKYGYSIKKWNERELITVE